MGYDLVIVANRLPVDRVEQPDGTSTWRPSPGGLVTAIEPVMRANAGIWMGWPGGTEQDLEPFEDDGGLFVASDVESADARRDVGMLLDDLPDRHRLPIQLVKLEGLSVAEAALRTGMSESAVKVGVHRGLKALAARIRSRS